MALITTYATLQTNIADWLNRSDLTAVVPTYIQLAEAKIKRVLRTKHKGTQEFSFVADDGDYTLPTGDIENYQLYIKTPEQYSGMLDPISPGLLYANRAANYNVTGRPVYYAIIDTTLLVSPVPDQDYTAELVFEGPFTALSDSNTTNYVLLNYPDVYLYGALMEASPYLMDDARIMVWDKKFTEAMAELERAQVRAEYPNTPVQRVPKNLSPSLTIHRR